MNYHVAVSITGLEKRLRGEIDPEQYGTWQILQDEKTGKLLTRQEVFAEIRKCRSLGYDVIPGCDKVNKKGRCIGH